MCVRVGVESKAASIRKVHTQKNALNREEEADEGKKKVITENEKKIEYKTNCAKAVLKFCHLLARRSRLLLSRQRSQFSCTLALSQSNEIAVVLAPRRVVFLLCLMLRLPTREQCVEWLQSILVLLSHIFSFCSSKMSLTRSRQLTLKWIKKRLAMTRRRERVSVCQVLSSVGCLAYLRLDLAYIKMQIEISEIQFPSSLQNIYTSQHWP